jgi:hypothetical protein
MTPELPTATRQPERFGPNAQALGLFLARQLGPLDLETLREIDRHFPGLSFRDFVGAHILAAALVMPTGGRA